MNLQISVKTILHTIWTVIVSSSDTIPKVIQDKETQHENSSSASGECHRGILKGRNVSQKKL